MSLTLSILLGALLFLMGCWVGYKICRYSANEKVRQKQLREKSQRELENIMRRRALLKRLHDRSRRNVSLRKKNASTPDKQS